jgi:hypothetical protein
MELVNATTFRRKFGEWRSIYTLTPDFLSRLGALGSCGFLSGKPHTRTLGGPRSRKSGESGNYVTGY